MLSKTEIGIIGAMSVEIEGLRSAMENKHTEVISGIEYVYGTLFGHSVVTAVCGIGKVFAAICTQTMILTFAPDVIINSGVAGTLTDKLSIGDAAVAVNAVQHDMDTTALGDEPGLLSGLDIVYIPTDEKVSERIAECVRELGVNCVMGTIATGDCFINDSEKKQIIAQRYSAIACEMEGGAIAHTCYVNKVPFSILRVISDGGDDNSHLDYQEFVKLASKRSIQIIENFIKKFENK